MTLDRIGIPCDKTAMEMKTRVHDNWVDTKELPVSEFGAVFGSIIIMVFFPLRRE